MRSVVAVCLGQELYLKALHLWHFSEALVMLVVVNTLILFTGRKLEESDLIVLLCIRSEYRWRRVDWRQVFSSFGSMANSHQASTRSRVWHVVSIGDVIVRHVHRGLAVISNQLDALASLPLFVGAELCSMLWFRAVVKKEVVFGCVCRVIA